MKVSSISNYLSLIKFSHTVFALPFAAIGFTLGLLKVNFAIDWTMAVKVFFCMVFARSAAMAFNRWADQKYDILNPRTASRELPSGIISAKEAIAFTYICSFLFIATTWFINPLCFYLSFVALAVVLGYSYTKRFTVFCHLILGIGLSLAPLGAYLAVTSQFDWLPILFSLAVLCWVTGFDIIYALQDELFDKANKLFSIPASTGAKKSMFIARNMHIASSLFILSAGLNGGFGKIYYAGWVFFSMLLVYQHSLIRSDDLSKVNLAFFTTNGIASIVFACFAIIDFLF